MKLILVTACANRKTVPVSKRLHARDLPNGNQEKVTRVWKSWIKEHPHRETAENLYGGRGFSEALKAKSFSDSPLWVISAGLGLVESSEEIPAYDLTLSPGSPNTISDKITTGNFSAEKWWLDLTRRHRPKINIATIIKNNPNNIVVISISSNYLELIESDLQSLSDDEFKHVRLIGPPIAYISEKLLPIYMPYDKRFDGDDSPNKGTGADFPQRVLRHFVENIFNKNKNASATTHSKLVDNFLSDLRPPNIPKRKQHTDDELINLMVHYWDEAEGKSANMLKVLRHNKSIACEQGRCGRLFKQAKRRIQSNNEDKTLTLRAVHTTQGNDVDVYSFFIPGALITKIADISRIHREDDQSLAGFQRKEIRQHVNGITEYLDQGTVLFPNSITLALSPEIQFKQTRGKDPEGVIESSQAGTLHIPLREEGNRVAWIVDGQQRSLALAKSKNHDLSVPVVAFVAPDMDTQREQFILVNKARPLPNRLINELLPEVDTYLPRELAARKIPSALCDLLSRDPDSPFYNLIKRMSLLDVKEAVITDSAIVEMIRASIKNPLGALAQYKGFGSSSSNVDEMYSVLIMYWNIVRDTFPDAWGKPPGESRLMHSAGIRAMGVLMDKIINRAMMQPDPKRHIHDSINKIAPFCCWTEGTWEGINLEWNEVQQIGRHVKALSDLLCHLDYEASVQRSFL